MWNIINLICIFELEVLFLSLIKVLEEVKDGGIIFKGIN